MHLPALLLKVRKQGGKHVLASIDQSIYLMVSHHHSWVQHKSQENLQHLSLLWLLFPFMTGFEKTRLPHSHKYLEIPDLIV